jgi:CHAT domain-containing protein
MPSSTSPPATRPRRTRLVRRWALGLLLILVAGVQLQRVAARQPDRPRGPVAALARELGSLDGVSPRLSIAAAYRPCRARLARDAGMPDMSCAAPTRWRPSPRIPVIAAGAARAVRERSDPGAMHAAALIDLLAGPGVGNALERTIQGLWTVGRTSRRPAEAWADLSAAYLIRAERGGTPRDLLAAVEAAERALEHRPANLAALYNRALALQRFGLADAAAWAWREYLAVDAASPWADEARRRLAVAVGGPVRPVPPPDSAASQAEYADYARRDPQAARVLGQDRLLGDWAAAVLAGDPARAEAWLRRATAVGDALRERPGGDQTLADQVQAIRRAGRGPALQALARAHREYAAGRALYEAWQYGAAEPRLQAAAEEGGPALRGWARLYLANVRIYAGQREQGESMLMSVIADADTVRHAALAGRAAMALAAVRVHTDRYELALQPAEAATRWCARAGERENEATVWSTLADAQFRVGEADGAYANWHRALMAMRTYRSSKRLHNLVIGVATAASNDGLPRAAVRVQDEGVWVSRRSGDALMVAEALLARARLLPAAGRVPGARRDVDSARVALAAVPKEQQTGWMGADLQVTEAVASLFERSARPEHAARALDSAAARFAERQASIREFPAVVRAAEARLAMGDLSGATVRLESAMALLERRRDSIRMEPRRAAVFDAARGVVDAVVMLHLAGGRPREALRFLDAGRASLAPSSTEPARSRRGAIAGPPGEVGVEYALIGDTLLAWTVAGTRVQVARTAIDTVELVRTLRRLQTLLQGERDEAAVDAALARLHGWLIRPVEARLGTVGTPLVIVADGDLAQVPFAALRGGRGTPYLTQRHSLRFAASLQEAWRARPPPGARGVVLVADPAFDPREHPGLPRLSGAADEARAISAAYAGGRLIPAESATRTALHDALAGAGVVHYAGHAVFDDERPERSYLVLAPLPGRPGSGRLTAGELARMDLPHAPLVVLAACRTVNVGRGRSSGFTGLAGGLLAAGARGVVGGLWEVDDALTQPLMVEFHRAYAAHGNGARALRDAQLRMIRSADPALRSPAAWAGFRYAGR